MRINIRCMTKITMKTRGKDFHIPFEGEGRLVRIGFEIGKSGTKSFQLHEAVTIMPISR